MAEELDQLTDDTDLLTSAETEYDLLFPVIPVEDDPSPPDDARMALVDDLADFAADEQPDIEEEEVGDDWAFDWGREEFFLDEYGDPLRVENEQAVIEWAQKALRTERGVYPIYSDAYGTSIPGLIGSNLPPAALKTRVQREVLECLSIHPRITNASVTEISQEGSILWLSVAFVIDDVVDEPAYLQMSY
jgi:hypothetical protein